LRISNRNTAWLGRVLTIALFIALAQAFAVEIIRVILMTIAGVFIIESMLDCRRISDIRMRSLIRMLLGELALLFTWFALNIVRVYTYESAVEGPDSSGRTAYWFVVSIQPYIVWMAIVVLVGFVALFTWRILHSRKLEGLDAKNV
jgi:hypothetical protein